MAGFFNLNKWRGDTLQLEVEETELSFGQELKGIVKVKSAAEFDVEKIWVRLRCEENIAKDNTTLYDVDVQVRGATHVNVGFESEFPFVIKLPSYGRETYHSSHENVQWLVDAYIKVKGIKDAISAEGGGSFSVTKPTVSVKEVAREVVLGGLSVADTLFTAHFEEAVEASISLPAENKFAHYTLAKGWFIRKKLLGGYDGFKATDICWAYPSETKHKVNGVHTNTIWRVNAKLKSEKEISLYDGNSKPKESLMPQVQACMQKLMPIVPWSFFSYNAYLVECWKKQRGLFLTVYEKRLNAIREGLKNGILFISQDGLKITPLPHPKPAHTATLGYEIPVPTVNSVVTPAFRLPNIGVRDIQNREGKISRIYIET